MEEKEKREMYIEEIFEKMILEAERRGGRTEIQDLYEVFIELGMLISGMLEHFVRARGE